LSKPAHPHGLRMECNYRAEKPFRYPREIEFRGVPARNIPGLSGARQHGIVRSEPGGHSEISNIARTAPLAPVALSLSQVSCAVAGDHVELSAGGIQVNGRLVRPLPRDAAGRRMRSWPFDSHTVEDGAVSVACTTPGTWDQSASRKCAGGVALYGSCPDSVAGVAHLAGVHSAAIVNTRFGSPRRGRYDIRAQPRSLEPSICFTSGHCNELRIWSART
jgi:hypothetical protein